MRANLTKSAWLVAAVTAILLLTASPSFAAASVEMTEENCGCNPCQEETAVPLCCCLTSGSLLPHCILPSAVADEVLLPSRLTPNENVYLVWSPTSVTIETSFNPKKPFQWESAQELPSYFYTEYYCRNCLDSEEPHQV